MLTSLTTKPLDSRVDTKVGATAGPDPFDMSHAIMSPESTLQSIGGRNCAAVTSWELAAIETELPETSIIVSWANEVDDINDKERMLANVKAEIMYDLFKSITTI